MPREYGAGQLARSLPLRASSRILLPQSDAADRSTAETLRSRGAEVTTVIAYHTVIGEGGADLSALIDRGEIDALTFTSPSAVAFFRRRCPSATARKLPAICIGKATAAAARAHGFNKATAPERATLRDMIAALAATFASTISSGSSGSESD